MASTKDIFEAKHFAAGLFAAGVFRGIGAAPPPAGQYTALYELQRPLDNVLVAQQKTGHLVVVSDYDSIVVPTIPTTPQYTALFHYQRALDEILVAQNQDGDLISISDYDV